jgi:hypothetical protein
MQSSTPTPTLTPTPTPTPTLTPTPTHLQDWQDTRKIVPSPHNLALLLYTSVLSALLAALGRLFFVAARGVARCFVKGAVKGV